MRLVPDEHVNNVATNLTEKVSEDDGKLQTGILGTRPLIHTIDDHGYDKLAYEVVSQPKQSGWVHMARNGATTMWERWDSGESVGSGIDSLNHSPFTHVCEYFYNVLAGIRIGDEPMTDRVTIVPAVVNDVDWMSANVDTPAGELAVAWETEGDAYDLSVTAPCNGRAKVRLANTTGRSVTESGVLLADGAPEDILSVKADSDDVFFEDGAGEYEFSVA